MEDFLFDGWTGIAKILIAAPVIYILVVALTRVSGKRSASQMNNFDWIVTVAIGSLVASAVLSQGVAIAEAALAITALFALQYGFTLGARRWGKVERLLKARPKILLAHGEFDEAAMDAERVTRSEILAAIRESGNRRLDEVEYVILESDARFSVIARGEHPLDEAVLATIRRPEGAPRAPD